MYIAEKEIFIHNKIHIRFFSNRDLSYSRDSSETVFLGVKIYNILKLLWNIYGGAGIRTPDSADMSRML